MLETVICVAEEVKNEFGNGNQHVTMLTDTCLHIHNRYIYSIIYVNRWMIIYFLTQSLSGFNFFMIHKQTCYSLTEILPREAADSTLTLAVRMQLPQLQVIEHPFWINGLGNGSSACCSNKAISYS